MITKTQYIAKAREWSRFAVGAATPERRAMCLRARDTNIILARRIHAAEAGDPVARWNLDMSRTLNAWGTTE